MRLFARHSVLIRTLLLAGVFGTVSVAAAIEASAQRFGGGFGRSFGGSQMTSGRNFGGGLMQGKRFTPGRTMGVRVQGSRSVASVPRDPRDPRPGRYPGRHPGRGIGVVIGSGVAIGTGVIVGNGPANAGPPPSRPPALSTSAPQGPRNARLGIDIPPNSEQRFVPNEVVLEFDANLSSAAIDQLAARHRLARLESQNFPLTNTTYFRARITDARSVRTVLRALSSEARLRSGQPNYIYRASQQAAAATLPASANAVPDIAPATPQVTPEVTPQMTPVTAPAIDPPAGDPAQYALAKLHLTEAHRLTLGDKVLVAVIDSGVDAGHPELKGVIAKTFDALGKAEAPHKHGTAIAGAIAAHARLMGVAPAARILAIRAFGVAGASAEATTFAILKSIDYAAEQGARIVNMSFAGPVDPGLSRHLAAAHEKGIVLVAASGNFGAKSPPQYPAADPNVIAVSATDANDGLFAASNRGSHIAVAAPGVDILLPAPNADYQVISGTSFAAAHVSGIVALLLARQPTLGPDAVRQILVSTAKDLGPAGKDDQFGAGLADAYGAVMALEPPAGTQPPSAQAQR